MEKLFSKKMLYISKDIITKSKKQSGQTSISAIIKTLVLLILAGSSLNMLSGDNSILVRTNEVAKVTAYATAMEELEIAYNSAYVENVAKAYIDREPEELQTSIKTEINKVLAKYKAQNERKTAAISINDNEQEITWKKRGNTYATEITLRYLSDGSNQTGTITVETPGSATDGTTAYQQAKFEWDDMKAI